MTLWQDGLRTLTSSGLPLGYGGLRVQSEHHLPNTKTAMKMFADLVSLLEALRAYKCPDFPVLD
jgi:hypothetical protein